MFIQVCLYRIFSNGNICCLHFWFLTFSLDILNRKIYALLCFYCFHVRRSSKQENTDFLILSLAMFIFGQWKYQSSHSNSSNCDPIFEVPNNTNFALNESIDYQEIIKLLNFELISSLFFYHQQHTTWNASRSLLVFV